MLVAYYLQRGIRRNALPSLVLTLQKLRENHFVKCGQPTVYLYAAVEQLTAHLLLISEIVLLKETLLLI